MSRSIIPGGPVRPAQFILPVIGMLLAFGASGQLPAQASRAPVMGAAGIAVDPAAIRLANATYRAIHEHPELGKQEVATQRLLHSALERIGYTRFVPSELAPTAVIAVLETGRRLVASVIAGATRPEQVTANVASAGWPLTSAEMAEVDAIVGAPA